jgi:dihydrodipicolinate synthase/N-acetylneuraminate lyase
VSDHLEASVQPVAATGETLQLRAKLAGVFAPICTPFARDESVDDEALRSNLARYAGSGLLGYLALGSKGRTEA